jgi:hypothetical protein
MIDCPHVRRSSMSRSDHNRAALCSRLRRLRELLDLARAPNDFTGTTTHFVRAASHRVCHMVAGCLPTPGHVVRDVGHALNNIRDVSCGALKTLGRRVPKAPR